MDNQIKLVNGKHYPMWQQFIDKKEEWIGGKLIDRGDIFDVMHGMADPDDPAVTVIKDIRLKPNGKDGAFFQVEGEDFTCGGSVEYLGISGGIEVENGICLAGYGGHKWIIQKP